jgi:hypothetical protein
LDTVSTSTTFGKYVASFCDPSKTNFPESDSCTICRSIGGGDDGSLLQQSTLGNGVYDRAATGANASMTSSVTFKDTSGAAAAAKSAPH